MNKVGTRLVFFSMGLSMAACAAPPLPIVPRPVTHAASPAAQPTPSANVIDIPDAPPPIKADEPKPMLEPTSAPSRAIEPIALPKAIGLQFLMGRSEDDLLLLAATNEVIEVTKGKAKSLGTPHCHESLFERTTREPALAAIVTRPGSKAVELWGRIERSGRGSWFEAYEVEMIGANSFKCHSHATDGVVLARQTGAVTWIEALNAYGPYFGTTTRRTLAAPPSTGRLDAWWGGAPDEAWIAQQDDAARASSLYRYNGTAWKREPVPPMNVVIGLYEDETGDLWALGTNKGTDGTLLARWNGSAWAWVPVPPDFSATMIQGTSSTNIWFFGNRHWYTWEGRDIHATSALFLATSVWASPEGNLWVGGSDLVEKIKVEFNSENLDVGRARLARIAAPNKGAH